MKLLILPIAVYLCWNLVFLMMGTLIPKTNRPSKKFGEGLLTDKPTSLVLWTTPQS